MQKQQENSKEYEVIFDPLAKSAILRMGSSITWMQGPYYSFRDAARAAKEVIDNLSPPRGIDSHSA